jgi:small subunit ribosomal protein S16
MLAIRLQRLGRKGYPTYRVAVQESHRHPTSGRIVAHLGNYNPHTKAVTIDADKAQTYLNNGAQPTPRVAKLLSDASVTLPSWVKVSAPKTSGLRHPDKLRKNQPKEEATDETPAAEESGESTEV